MPFAILLALCIGLFILTLWGMRRFRRGRFLQLLATLMKRRLALEPALADLSHDFEDLHEARMCGQIVGRLQKGYDLPTALRNLRYLDEQQEAALEVAGRHGRTGQLLADLAGEKLGDERRVLRSLVLVLYPFIVGALLLGYGVLTTTFVLPKFERIFTDMEIAVSPMFGSSSAWICVGALLWWGLFSLSMQHRWLGGRLWSRWPVLGTHFHMEAQARIARMLGKMLHAGATLEESLHKGLMTRSAAASEMRLSNIRAQIEAGVPPLEAFRTNGPWREEFLWAWDAIARGAEPRSTLEEVAQVLEEKGEARLRAANRILLPVAVVTAGLGVGSIVYSTFYCLLQIAEKLIAW